MTGTYTVGNYLLDRLKEVGVEHVFGVPGDYGFPFLDQIEADPGITWVGSCNELNAAYSADGYARVRGMSAIAGSCGVLEMGAAGGIAGAYAEEVPLLVISGFPSHDQRVRGSIVHHSLRGRFDQYEAMLAPITGWQTLVSADQACRQLDQAIQECWTTKSPVYVQFPSDVQQSPAEPPASPLVLAEPQSDPAQLDAFVAQAVQLLRSAERPAILLDYMVERYGLTDAVQGLSASAGIPLATTLPGRCGGIDQTRPGYLGYYVAARPPAQVRQRIDSSDALIRVCLRRNDSSGGSADPRRSESRLIDLQADSATLRGSVYQVAARDVLARLSAELPVAQPLPRVQLANVQAPFAPRPGALLTQDRLWQAFAGFVERGDTIAIDYGTIQAVSMLSLAVPTRALLQASWDAIGWTTPAVLGAQLADPAGRYLQVVGDGGFQETAQEVSTVLRCGLAPITILLNNTTYQVENDTHVDAPVRKAYNELHVWDYSQLPGVLGAESKPLGLRVGTEDELAAALDAAAAAHREGRYSLIEVIVAADDLASVMADHFGLPRATTT